MNLGTMQTKTLALINKICEVVIMDSMLDKFKSIELDKPEPKKDEPKFDILTKDMVNPLVDMDGDVLEFDPEIDVSQQLDLMGMIYQSQTTEQLLGYCDTILNGFGIINSNLGMLDDVMVENGQLDKSLLDLADNCQWFVNKAYAVLMPYGYHITGSNPIEKTKSIINALVSIKNDLMKGNVNNQNDYEYILLVLYMDFFNYGSFIGMD